MKLILLLGDLARVAEGKLDVLGVGWTVAGPGPVNLGIGILAEVAWAEMGEEHHVQLALLDDRGEPVVDAQGEPLFKIDAALHTERPPGVLLGAPGVFPMALNLSAVPLAPGGRFRLQATVNGRSNLDWEVAFSTRAA